MNGELLSILEHIERDKGIKRQVLIRAIESALLSAAKKTIKGKKGELSVEFDEETGDIKVFSCDEIIESDEFGRIAAQTAKQVIIQKIREAERDVIYKEFKDKVNQIVSGTVYRFEHSTVVVNLGRTEGFIPKKFQVANEEYKQGERLRVYIEKVEQTTKGPRIILSRNTPQLVTRLFELEVPEICEKIVEIKSIAREAGERTKIAVYSHDERVDSVGACVGVRGSRVKNIVKELQGEKIDIVRWSPDLKEYVKNALSPAKIMDIRVNGENSRILLVVNDDELSIAIGKHGQNVRLASQLIGKEIDIKSASEISRMVKKEVASLSKLNGIGAKIIKNLAASGIKTIKQVAESSVKELIQVPGIGKKTAEKIIEQAKEVLKD
ncbi:MAG TPA: transcription termination/antitermination protein NusA [Candidatus Omnitrophica bacterium]|nr:transcription termination/antitermination protein NusA [Candidatus Omnitrophota bacterium]